MEARWSRAVAANKPSGCEPGCWYNFSQNRTHAWAVSALPPMGRAVARPGLPAGQHGQAGIHFEDLSGIRASAWQRKDTKSDAGQNSAFVRYTALAAGVAVDAVPLGDQPTSKACAGGANTRRTPMPMRR